MLFQSALKIFLYVFIFAFNAMVSGLKRFLKKPVKSKSFNLNLFEIQVFAAFAYSFDSNSLLNNLLVIQTNLLARGIVEQ